MTDVEATARRLRDLGGESLGPMVRARDGSAFAIVRDPVGAVMAVREGARTLQRSPVAWHQLHTKDLDDAIEKVRTPTTATH